MKHYRRYWKTWLLLSVLLMTNPLRATVLRELSFEELVQGSALIVLAHVSERTMLADGEMIYTDVVLDIEEVIAGDFNSSRLELRFVGGEYQGHQVEIAGQYIPAPGDYGVYFIADPASQNLVSPLTGWHQGAFLLEDAGDEGYLDLAERPDLVRFNISNDPLALKMLATGFSEAQVSARYPAYQRFALQDFIDAIQSLHTLIP